MKHKIFLNIRFKSIIILIMAILFLSFFTLQTFAQDSQRDVLALYNFDLNGSRFLNSIFKCYEPALSHLGLILHYYNLDDGIPDFKTNPQFDYINKVIITLEHDEIKEPKAFWSFVKILLEANKKVIFMNWPGPLIKKGQKTKNYTEEANRALSSMGLMFGQIYSKVMFDIDIEYADNPGFETFSKIKSFFEAPYMGYETPVKKAGLTFLEIKSYGKNNKVILKLRKKSTNTLSDSIVITPNGGFAAAGCVFTENPVDDSKKLKLNIYKFFEKAFDIVGQPRPDVSVINGRRVYFSHIDGDGFNSATRYDPNKICGQAMYDFFKKYNDLPVSCSVITSEISSKKYSTRDSVKTAQKIFSLPNIEPASHTHTHPLIWDKAIHPEGAAGEYAGDIEQNNKSDYYTSYVVDGYKFSRKYEVKGAIDYINKQLVSAKKGLNCSTVFWSGNCLPGKRALEYSFENGLNNINGGDSRFDSFFDSRLYLCPVLRVLEDSIAFQIWAASCNENIYTNLWQGPYYGFSNVIQTFENTGKPDILKPVDVYYHHYSAERLSSIKALDKIMAWVRKKNFFKVFASDYCHTVFGYRYAVFTRKTKNSWSFEKANGLETIRFDIPDSQVIIDMDKSHGIIGFRRLNSSLYAFLDSSSNGKGTVVLKKLNTADNKWSEKPFLQESSSYINNLVFIQGAFEFNFEPQRAGNSRECTWVLPENWQSLKLEPADAVKYEIRDNKLEITVRNKKTIRVKVINNS